MNNEIMTKYDFLVTKFASKYKGYSNYQDLLQEGRIALLQALKTHDAKKGSIECWAYYYIKTVLARKANWHLDIHVPIRKYKANKTMKSDFDLNRIISSEDSPENSLLKEQLHIRLQSAIKCLNDIQQYIIRDYLNDIPMINICKKYKMNRNTYLKEMANIKRLLKNELI